MAATIVASLLGYVFWVLVARGSPPATLGEAAVVITSFTLVGNAASLGVRNVIVARIAAADDSTAWGHAFVEGLLMALATTALALLLTLVWFLGYSTAPFTAALIFGAGAMASAIAGVVDATCVAERASKLLVATTAAAALTRVMLVPLLALGRARWEWVAALWIASLCLGSGFGLTRLLVGRTRSVVRLRGGWRSLRRAAPHYSLQQFVALTSFAPSALLPLIVAVRLSTTAGGYYYAASRLGGVFLMVSPAVASALVAEGARSRGRLADSVRHAAALIGLLVVPTGIVLIAFGHSLLSIFGKGYATHGYWLVVVLVVASVPDAVTNLYVAVARVYEALRGAAFLNGAMAVMTLVVAWVLLPSVGLVAAGLAWLIAQGVGAMFVPLLARRMAPAEVRSAAV